MRNVDVLKILFYKSVLRAFKMNTIKAVLQQLGMTQFYYLTINIIIEVGAVPDRCDMLSEVKLSITIRYTSVSSKIKTFTL